MVQLLNRTEVTQKVDACSREPSTRRSAPPLCGDAID